MSHASARAQLRYFDAEHQCTAVKLLPNEYCVVGPDDAIGLLSTVLGSCVAACLHDPQAGVSGMNHFMLAGSEPGNAATMRYGSYAMEVLINEMLKAGAARTRLQAKVFGGGAVLAQMTHLAIGDNNADFVLDYLAREQIPVLAQDLRGTRARRVHLLTASGEVKVRKIGRDPAAEADLAAEVSAWQNLRHQPLPRGGRIERLQPQRPRHSIETDR